MTSSIASVFIVVLAFCVAQSAAHTTTYPKAWARPGECLAIPLKTSAGYGLQSVSVRARPEAARLWHTVYNGPEDDAQMSTACLEALQSEGATAALEHKMYVLIKNEGSISATAELTVSLQRVATVASQAEQDIEDSGAAVDGTDSQGGSRGVHVYNRRRLSQSTTDQPTTDQITKQINDSLSNALSPTQKKWIKIAIIVAIVIGCLMVLSCLFCLIRCICMPCCCARRFIK